MFVPFEGYGGKVWVSWFDVNLQSEIAARDFVLIFWFWDLPVWIIAGAEIDCSVCGNSAIHWRFAKSCAITAKRNVDVGSSQRHREEVMQVAGRKVCNPEDWSLAPQANIWSSSGCHALL
jgi:hypothetical protein